MNEYQLMMELTEGGREIREGFQEEQSRWASKDV